MKRAGIAVGAALAIGVIAYTTTGYVRSWNSSSEARQAQIRDENTPNSIPAKEIGTPAAEKPELTQQEALWGMSKADLMKKFFTYDEKYYSTVDANRIQQTRPLEPGEKRPNIKVIRGGFQMTLKGQEAPEPIEVLVPPNMPCTFDAQDLGYFKENGKTCITVKADERGIARVHYVASETGGGSLIMAHSPEALGWGRIQVTGLSQAEYERLKKERPQMFAKQEVKE